MPQPTSPQAESDFVTALAARLESEEAAASAETAKATTTDDSTKDAASGASDESEHQSRDGAAADRGATEHDDAEDVEGEDDGAGTDGTDGTEATTDDDDAGKEVVEEEEEDGAGTDGTDNGTDEGAESKEAKADKAIAASVQDALEKAGLKLSLKDLPAEVQPIVQRKLEHMQATLTRAMQEQTAFRKERATFQADQQFRAANPEMVIAELLEKGGDELAEKVNALVEKLADPDKKRLFDTDLKDARQKALDAIVQVEEREQRQLARADEIESYTRRACGKLKIPVEVVEQAIALEIMNSDKGDLSEQELDKVITRQAKILRGDALNRTRETRQENIRDRTRDRATSTPAVRTGSGTPSPRPGGAKPPKNDAEFTERMLQKI